MDYLITPTPLLYPRFEMVKMKCFIHKTASYLGISNDITATICVTIVVFLFGVVVNIIIHNFRNYKERSIHRKISKINHKLLIDGLRKEAKNLKCFSNQLIIDHHGSYSYMSIDLPYVIILKKIGYANLYKAYFTGIENFFSMWRRSKIDAFNDLWLTAEFLSIHHINSRIKGEKYIELNGKYNELRNFEVQKAQDLLEEFRIRFNRQLESSEPLAVFYTKREKIMKKYKDTPNNTLPRKTNEYLNQILELNRNNVSLLTRYNSDTNPVELNSHILTSNYRYENQKNHIESAKFYFDSLYDEYIKSNEKLIRSYKILNFKRFSFSFKKIKPYIIIQVRVIFKKLSL